MDDYIEKNESKFGEPYQESEVFNITYDYDEWKENTLRMNNDEFFKAYFSEDVDRIAKNVKGYLLGPVAKNGKDVLTAKVAAFKNFEDVEKNVDLSKIYLYYFSLRKNVDDGLYIAMRYTND